MAKHGGDRRSENFKVSSDTLKEVKDGITTSELAESLNVSVPTIKRDIAEVSRPFHRFDRKFLKCLARIQLLNF